MRFFNFSAINRSKSKLSLALLSGSLMASGLTIAVNLVNSASLRVMAQPQTQSDLNLTTNNTVVSLPMEVAIKVIDQAAKDLKQSPKQFTVTAVKSEMFDSCLGIYSRQPCKEIAIYGWKVVVQNRSQNLVYHLDRNATRIIQNKTASVSRSKLHVVFMPLGTTRAPLADNVVFRSSEVNQLSGAITRTELTEDGNISVLRGKAQPIVIKKLSPAQLKAFKMDLETYHFPDFNGIHYLTYSEKTDFLTTNYQIHNVSTQIMNSEKKNLPSSLQRIISNWEGLTGPTNPKLVKLQKLLQEKKWAEADQETRQLLRILSETPNSLLREIDQAWLTASNNRFGLSIQAKILQQSRAKYPKDREAAIHEFRARVGWKITKPRIEHDFISSDWLNESEVNYSIQAPIGHLPWAGVSDAEVYAVYKETGNGCGSCTTDAMQLRNEHFYGWIPLLLDRVRTALNLPQ